MKSSLFVSLATFAVLFLGCGGQPESSPAPTALRPLLETPTASATTRKPLGSSGDAEYGSFRIPAAALQEVKRTATEAEAPIVDDGVITFAEYEQLAFTRMACWEANGLTVSHSVGFGRTDSIAPGPYLTHRGEYVFHASGRPGQSWADGRQAVDKCDGTYPQVEFFWLGVHTEPTEEERQAHRDAIATCLRQGGHDAPLHPSQQDLKLLAFPPDGIGSSASEPPWFQTCHWAANDAFEVSGAW